MMDVPALPRVIWDTTFAQREWTGTRIYTRNLYHAVAATQRVTLQELRRARASHGAPRRGALSAAQNILWLTRGLERALNARAPDLLHVAAYVGPRRAPCPIIANIFDITYLAYPQDFDWKWRAYARWVIPHTARTAAAIVTLSEHARGEIIRAYQLAPERVHIVAPGIGSEFHPPIALSAVEKSRAQYNLSADYLLYVGAANERKNISALIAAFARLRADFPRLTFVLAGHPFSSRDKVTQALRAHAVENAVTRLAYVPQADLPLLYAGARAFVYASKLEGFGMPPVEAMACGTPVVAAPNPPLPDVLGAAAYWADDDSPAALARAIRRVLTDETLAQTLRARGIARAQMYTWQDAARKTIQVYENVLQNKTS